MTLRIQHQFQDDLDPSKWSDEQIRQYRLWAELHDGNTLVHYKDDPAESYAPRSGRGRRSA